MMKKWISLLLVLTLAVSLLCPTVLAAEENAPFTPERAAGLLSSIGVFRGTGSGFDLDRAPTRLEAAVMLVRMNGAEFDAQTQFAQDTVCHPFGDVPAWGASYVAWLYENGMTHGMSAQRFGADLSCRAKDYAVFLLRAMGYVDDEDFTYAEAETCAASLGFYLPELFGGTFTRGDLAVMTWFALFAPCKEGGTLLEQLVDAGAVDRDGADALETAYAENGLALCAEGLLVDPDVWSKAEENLTVTVDVASNSPKLSGGTLTLDRQTWESLTEPGGGNILIPASGLRQLAADWDNTYGVRSGPFLFDSYIKGWTEISFLTCDYKFDADTVVKSLLYCLLSLEPGAVDAPLACYRGGKPFSLGNTYAEVDIDNQKVTFFKNGKLMVSTDVVTGQPNGHQTPTGLYYSHNKQTNCTLVGDDYRVFVQYWISIVGNAIGFHDASWRSAFGKEYYVNGGSHGCINTPTGPMITMFNNMDDGTPVLIHGRNQWYNVNDPAASPVTKNPAH